MLGFYKKTVEASTEPAHEKEKSVILVLASLLVLASRPFSGRNKNSRLLLRLFLILFCFAVGDQTI